MQGPGSMGTLQLEDHARRIGRSPRSQTLLEALGVRNGPRGLGALEPGALFVRANLSPDRSVILERSSMKRLLSVLAVLIAVGATPTEACKQASLTPPGATEISSFLAGAVGRQEIPGVVAIVVGCDGILYHEAFGMQDRGRDLAMRKDTIFRIASMTKPVTSLAIIKLVDEGRLGLDDGAKTWVPWLRAPKVLQDVDLISRSYRTRPAVTPITVRHLLTHTSGIGYDWSDPGLALVRERDPEQIHRDLLLVTEPGTAWTYGSGTNALGDILVALSGQPLDAHLNSVVIGPLGMTDTSYVVPKEKATRVATIHRRTNYSTREDPNPDPLPGYVNADGGLFSTAEDYGRLVRMLLNDGVIDGRRVLSEEAMRLARAPQMGDLRVRTQPAANPGMTRPFPLGAGTDTWGLGFQLAGPGGGPDRRSEGSMSWAGLYNTFFWADPARGVGAVLLMQVLPFYDANAIDVLQGFEQRVYRHLD
jgi:CubicO group peptidase (beta-lactamase class C family)